VRQHNRSVAAIDLDGPLHWYREGYQDGTMYDPPTPGALFSMRQLLTTFEYDIEIYTARDTPGQWADACAWLAQHWRVEWPQDDAQAVTDADGRWYVRLELFPSSAATVMYVSNIKPKAHIYIDDRAIRFTDWKQTIWDLDAIRHDGYGDEFLQNKADAS